MAMNYLSNHNKKETLNYCTIDHCNELKEKVILNKYLYLEIYEKNNESNFEVIPIKKKIR